MGILANRSNARKTEPMAMPIGPWLDEAQHQVPFVPKDQLFGWAGIGTVLTAPLTSNTSVTPDGRQNSIARWLREQPSILRFDSTRGTTTVDLGGIRGLGEWKQDWSLRFAQTEPNGQCLTDVPAFSTRDNMIVNPEALEQTRSVLAETMAQGPRLRVHEGRPDAGAQIATIGMDHVGSPLANDFHMPPQPSATDTWTINASSDLVMQVAQFFRFRTSPGGEPGVDLIYLAPDGNPARGVLRVRQSGPETCLLDASPIGDDLYGQVRWKRRLATALNWLSISKTLSSAAPQLTRFRDAVVGGTGTRQGWQPVWTDQIPAPAWRLTPAIGEFPVCVRLRSERGFQGADCGLRAMDSVAAFRRGFGGITGKHVMWGSRRPSQLTLDQGKSRQPRVRYGCHTEESDAVSSAVIPDPAHFWEVQWHMVGDSWNDTIVTVTAMSRMRDLLPYAQELQAYLGAYCDLALGYDPDIQFTTVSLAY